MQLGAAFAYEGDLGCVVLHKCVPRVDLEALCGLHHSQHVCDCTNSA